MNIDLHKDNIKIDLYKDDINIDQQTHYLLAM